MRHFLGWVAWLGLLGHETKSASDREFADSILAVIPESTCLELSKASDYWSYRWCHRQNVILILYR